MGDILIDCVFWCPSVEQYRQSMFCCLWSSSLKLPGADLKMPALLEIMLPIPRSWRAWTLPHSIGLEPVSLGNEASSYVKDTLHFLQMIENVVIPESVYLVTIDVESLYNNIPHTKSLAAIRHVLLQQNMAQWKFNKCIFVMLNHILYNNDFQFQGSHYLQVQDVAMGTCCSPSYANLYLREWEQGFLSDESLSNCILARSYSGIDTSTTIFCMWWTPISANQMFRADE